MYKFADVTQLARVTAFQAVGCAFESRHPLFFNLKNNILVKFDPKISPRIHNNGCSGLNFSIGLDFDPFYPKNQKKK